MTSNSSVTVAWDPPTFANGILRNYTVRVYNQLNDYYTEYSIQPYDTHFISVDDLGEVALC